MNEFATVWGEAMFRACWQGAIFILLAAAACRFGRGISAGAKCTLWWLACGKLALGLIWIAPPAIPLLPVEKTVAVAASPVMYEALNESANSIRQIERIGRIALTTAPPEDP